MASYFHQRRASLITALPFVVLAMGFGLVLFSGAIEYLWSGSSSGFGSRRANVAVVGLVIFLTAAVIAVPMGKRAFFRWVLPSTPYLNPAIALVRTRQLLLLTVWSGLLLGFSDLYYLANRKFIDDDQIRFTEHIVWMAPVGGLWIAGAIGATLAVASLRWPGLASLRVVAVALGVPLYWNLLMIGVPKVHFLALLVLALGLSLITARLVDRYAERFYGLVHRTTIPLILVGVALTLVVLIPARTAESRAFAAMPPAQTGKPNVILITLDTVRASSMSVYGYDRPTTPNLERFAQQGVAFAAAISPSPWTLPGHSSMFTGRWPHELSSDFFSPLDDTYPTLAEVLYSNGYDTAGFSANMWYGPRELGLDRGMVHYEGLMVTPLEIVRSSFIMREVFHLDNLGRFTGDLPVLSRKNAQTMNQDFLRWLDRRPDPERPFFGFINYFDAHEPYYVTPEFGLRFAGKEKPLNTWKVNTDQPDEVVLELNNSYDASIAYLDEQIAILFDELERRDELENTLVIITSDHGEHFGERRILGHANSLYPQLTHVPLVVSLPGTVPSDLRVAVPVSLRDIPATVVDLLALEEGAVFPGDSLARFWKDNGSGATSDGEFLISEVTGQDWIAEWYPAFLGDMKSLIGDSKLHIRNADGREEFYDIYADPLAERDLVDSPEAQPLLEESREFMETLPSEASYSPP